VSIRASALLIFIPAAGRHHRVPPTCRA